MDKLLKIIHHSISAASRQPSWWLFALLQAAAFSVIGQLARPWVLSSPVTILLVMAAILLAPVTIWLWQNIEAGLLPITQEISVHKFTNQSLSGAVLILITVLIIILARFIFPFWPIHTLVFAVAASTSGLALLYLALNNHSLLVSLRLAMDTWNKKISLSATAALVLIITHGMSFALARGVVGNLYISRAFPVFNHSATIWIMLLGLMLAIGYFSAILNCFVVYLFLDTIARKKDPEAEKIKISQPARIGVS